MRTLITAVFAAMLVAPAQARTPDKVEVDDVSVARIENETPWQWPVPNPAVGATKPWLILVTFFYRNEPLLGGGDRFASREDCEVARRKAHDHFNAGAPRARAVFIFPPRLAVNRPPEHN